MNSLGVIETRGLVAAIQAVDLRSRHPRLLWLRLSGCLSDTGTRNHLITPKLSPLALPITENLR